MRGLGRKQCPKSIGINMFGSTPVWGIDIGANAVKGVKFLAQNQEFEIVDFDVLPHRGDPEPLEGPIPDRRAWRTLALFQERHRIRSEYVVVSVPGQCVFTRPLRVIEVQGKPLNDLVRYEVQQLLGLDLDAVMWDYDLFPKKDAEDRNREGVLFAMRRTDYNPFVRSLNAARIHVDNIQTLPLALYNYALHSIAPRDPLLLMDIGADSVTLLAIYNEKYWARSLATGGRRMTKALQEAFDCDFQSAEAIKVNAGKSKHARELLKRMMPTLRSIVGEMQNAVNLLRSDVPQVDFNKAVVVGGASRTLGLNHLISKELKLAVTTPDPLAGLPVSDEVDRRAIQEAAPSLPAACGLALQGTGRSATRVSLVSAGTVRGKQLARTRPFAIASLVVAAVLVGLHIAFGYVQLEHLSQRNQEFHSRLAPTHDLRQKWQAASRPTEAEKRLDNFVMIGEHRDTFLDSLRKVVRMFTLSISQRPMWIRDVTLRMPRSDQPGKRYTETDVLRVKVEGATARRGNEGESDVRRSVNANVASYLQGLREVGEGEPDVITMVSTEMDRLAPPTSTGAWRYMFFKVEFDFKMGVGAMEEAP